MVVIKSKLKKKSAEQAIYSLMNTITAEPAIHERKHPLWHGHLKVGSHSMPRLHACKEMCGGPQRKLRTFDTGLHWHIVCVCPNWDTEWLCMWTKWLKIVVPVSVEAQGGFSSVGNVVTKIRAHLNDETVNALVCLKTYYSCLRWAYACMHYEWHMQGRYT